MAKNKFNPSTTFALLLLAAALGSLSGGASPLAAATDGWRALTGGPEGSNDIRLAWGRWAGEPVLFATGGGALWRLSGSRWSRLDFVGDPLVALAGDPVGEGIWTATATELVGSWRADARRLQRLRVHDRILDLRRDADTVWILGARGLHSWKSEWRAPRRAAAQPVSDLALADGRWTLETGQLTGPDGSNAGPAEALLGCGGLWVRRNGSWTGPDGQQSEFKNLTCAGRGRILAWDSSGWLAGAGPGTAVRETWPAGNVTDVAAVDLGSRLRIAVAAGATVWLREVAIRPPAIPAAGAEASGPTRPDGLPGPEGLRPFAEIVAAAVAAAAPPGADPEGWVRRARRASWLPTLRLSQDHTQTHDADWAWTRSRAIAAKEGVYFSGPYELAIDGGETWRWSTGLTATWDLDRLLYSSQEPAAYRSWERWVAERERRANLAAGLWNTLAEPGAEPAARRRAAALLGILCNCPLWLDERGPAAP